jgi:hypothetical protein
MRAISARAAIAPPIKNTTVRRRRECHFCASRFRASSSSLSSLARRRRRRRERCLKTSTRAASALDNDVIETATTAIITTTTSTSYEPTAFSDSLLEAGIEPWQLYFGFFAGLAPFIIAAYEFGKRILIQRKCALCRGSGLIKKGEYSRKCTSCGGFLPWESWERFLDVGTTAKIGNGGRVRVPEGQTSVFYDVEKTVAASEERRRAEEEKRNAEERAEQESVVVSAAAATDTADTTANGAEEE